MKAFTFQSFMPYSLSIMWKIHYITAMCSSTRWSHARISVCMKKHEFVDKMYKFGKFVLHVCCSICFIIVQKVIHHLELHILYLLEIFKGLHHYRISRKYKNVINYYWLFKSVIVVLRGCKRQYVRPTTKKKYI